MFLARTSSQNQRALSRDPNKRNAVHQVAWSPRKKLSVQVWPTSILWTDLFSGASKKKKRIQTTFWLATTPSWPDAKGWNCNFFMQMPWGWGESWAISIPVPEIREGKLIFWRIVRFHPPTVTTTIFKVVLAIDYKCEEDRFPVSELRDKKKKFAFQQWNRD